MNREDIICPGETIKELLEVFHYTQLDLANKLEMDLKTVNEILNGKAPITVETAIKLEMIFNIDAIFWNNLEFNYRRKIKESEEREIIEEEYQNIKLVYKEMVKRELILETKDKYEVVNNFKKYMGITKIENLSQEFNSIYCRQSNIKNFDMLYLMVWIEIGLKKAREKKINAYSKEKVLNNIEKIRKLTLMENQQEAREKLINICEECGIIVNFEKSMPNTAIYGIARWLDSNTPFIQISDKGKNVATFWFTFMHELGHIVNGRKKLAFLDMDNKIIDKDEELQILKDVEEAKADKFSRESLIPENKYKVFKNEVLDKRNVSFKDIIIFANKVGVAPTIIAGRIKYDKKIYNDKILNAFNIRMEF